MTLRTVTLELMREGPPYNQLLSPLTPYFAVCGNRPVEVVHVGTEHQAYIRKLSRLRYREGEPATPGELEDAAREVNTFLRSIRALGEELSVAATDHSGVHLQLILSASELAIMPFELAHNPADPNKLADLSMKRGQVVAVTRAIRRIATEEITWPSKPHILVIAADPDGRTLPLRATLAALCESLAPWSGMLHPTADILKEFITVVESASIDDVRREFLRVSPTHVHILAHGGKIVFKDSDEGEYGLVFHQPRDPKGREVVSGWQLAMALGCTRPLTTTSADASPSVPAVVTIAACDSGNVGSVVAPSASVAYALHDAGIPFVIGSQIPLSFAGATILTSIAYRGLVRADDPRKIVHDLRQELYVRLQGTQDWAALVVYASLPDNLEDQLRTARLESAAVTMDRVIRRLERSTVHSMRMYTGPLGLRAESNTSKTEAWRSDIALLKGAIEQHTRLAEQIKTPALVPAVRGRLASANKRLAWQLYPHPLNAPPKTDKDRGDWLDAKAALLDARECYRQVLVTGNESWAHVQALAIDAVLANVNPPPSTPPWSDRWVVAHTIAFDELNHHDPPRRAWAYHSLIELAVLAGYASKGGTPVPNPAEEAAMWLSKYLEFLTVRSYPRAVVDAHGLWRQLARYVTWWWSGKPEAQLPLALCLELETWGVPIHFDDDD